MISPAKPDGLPIAEVGVWARDKLRLIEEYIKISRICPVRPTLSA
ncbi:MAG TPA: hypothetical protein VF814_16315 [Casimicrobiaceae bacterium]